MVTWPLAVLIALMAVLASGLLVRSFGAAVVTFLSGLLYGIGGVLLWTAVGIRAVFGRAPGFLGAAGRGLGRAGAAIGRAGLALGGTGYRWVRRLLGILCWLVIVWLLSIDAGVAFQNWWAVAFFLLLPLLPVLLWKLAKLMWWSARRPVYALLLLALGFGAWQGWQKLQTSGLVSATVGWFETHLDLKARQKRLQATRLKGESNAADHKALLLRPNQTMRTGKVGEPTDFYQEDGTPISWKGSEIIPAGTPVVRLSAESHAVDDEESAYVRLPGPRGSFVGGPTGWIAVRRLDFQDPIPRVRPTPAVSRLGEITIPPEAQQYVQLVDKHLASHSTVPRNLVLAAIQVESKWDPRARNEESGALGLMQLLPDTAKLLGVTDPFDPDQNIGGGIRYLAEQLANFSSTELALAAYHWGPENIRKHPGKTWEQILTSSDEPRPGPRTIAYVRDVIALARGGARQPAAQLAAAPRQFPLRVLNWREDIAVRLYEVQQDGVERDAGEIPPNRVGREPTTTAQKWVVRGPEGALLARVESPRPAGGPEGAHNVDIH